jgi:hypothetical protein
MLIACTIVADLPLHRQEGFSTGATLHLDQSSRPCRGALVSSQMIIIHQSSGS